MIPFREYMSDVKDQLYCNASDDYKSMHTTYDYTNEQVSSNLAYFARCMKRGLSPYKALLFFGDYMNGEVDI